jgi:hypothetical protein
MTLNKDYRLKVTIRNDRLLTAMENIGFESMAQFTKTHGLEYQRTGEIFNGKLKPLNEKGELKPLAKEILSILNLEVSEAFTERQLKGFTRTTFEKRVNEKDLLKLANPVKNHEFLLMEKDVNKVLDKMLGELGPRYEKIVRMVNGIGGQEVCSFKQIALEFKIGSYRVSQIYLTALRKLSTPKNLEKLKNAGISDLHGIFRSKGIIKHQRERNLL